MRTDHVIRAVFLACAMATVAGCTTTQQPTSAVPELPALPTTVAAAPAKSVPACTLLQRADVVAVAANFMTSTSSITVAQQGEPGNIQGENSCIYTEQGFFTESDGIKSSLLSGAAAELTLITGGADYAFDAKAGPTVSGLGDGAYWSGGTNEVVVRKGSDVLKITDNVPVDSATYSDLKVPYEKAAEDLAAKVLAHL